LSYRPKFFFRTTISRRSDAAPVEGSRHRASRTLLSRLRGPSSRYSLPSVPLAPPRTGPRSPPFTPNLIGRAPATRRCRPRSPYPWKGLGLSRSFLSSSLAASSAPSSGSFCESITGQSQAYLAFSSR